CNITRLTRSAGRVVLYSGHRGWLCINLQMTIGGSRAFLSSIGIAGEIVATPGHSDDSVSLVLDAGAAFTGDLPPPGFVDESTSATVRQSWEKLRALPATKIYPGHGPVRPLRLRRCRHALTAGQRVRAFRQCPKGISTRFPNSLCFAASHSITRSLERQRRVDMILLANLPGGGAGPHAPETFLFCTWCGRQSRPHQVQNQMLLGGQSPLNLPSE